LPADELFSFPKGIGRIYLQVAVDTFCSLAFAELFTAKTAITAAHMLNEFFRGLLLKKYFNSLKVKLQFNLSSFSKKKPLKK
jgi:hypothetical protein